MLSAWIHRLSAVRHWGYVLAFLATFLESLPAIGLVIPGQTVILLLGFLSQQGTLAFAPLAALAIAGAFVGDAVAYLLGRRYGVGLLGAQRGIVRDVLHVLREHPVKTIVLGRFNSLTRAFAPFTAGASGVRPRSFLFANLLGSALWSLSWLLVGFAAGASYSLVAARIDAVVLLIALVLTAAFVSYGYLRRQRLVSPEVRALLMGSILSSLAFAAVWWAVATGALAGLDEAVRQTVAALRTPLATTAMLLATSLLEPVVATVLTIGFAGVLWSLRRPQDATLVTLTVLTSAMLDDVLKEIVLRSRPAGALVATSGFSFPSGHAMVAIVLFGGAALVLRREPFWRARYWWVAGALVALVAASRVYLGAHWLTDVVGGLLAGLGWLSLVFLWYEAYRSHRQRRQHILVHGKGKR